ncbi:MAG: PilZ domain-containing protein [Deltaproteobacteria bacterium]|nr:PilZ domain-containing protein [Deltaproteobacteria bacterium]MBW1913928.1 PilZ domain-containing protein [Deltaproteobacteria bacterium]
MEFQKAFIRDDGTIRVNCPDCKAQRSIITQKVFGKHQFKVKCTCGSVFGIQCEFREKFRKDVDLNGVILKPSENLRWGKTLNESQQTQIDPINCKVRNISIGGVGLKTFSMVDIAVGDPIMVKFTLDNTASSEIEKKAIVRGIRETFIGCEFLDADKNDPKLGFYLL